MCATTSRSWSWSSSATRQFAERLRRRGVQVRYVRLDDPANSHSLEGELRRALAEAGPFNRAVATEPGEWRLAQVFAALRETLDPPLEIRPDRRFIASHRTFAQWAADKRELTMEFFYRQMRKETGLLMHAGKPAGDRWNFDAENRKRLPPGAARPSRRRFPPNAATRTVMAEVAARFPENFGALESFRLADQPRGGGGGARSLPRRHPARFRRLGRTPWPRPTPSSGTA